MPQFAVFFSDGAGFGIEMVQALDARLNRPAGLGHMRQTQMEPGQTGLKGQQPPPTLPTAACEVPVDTRASQRIRYNLSPSSHPELLNG